VSIAVLSLLIVILATATSSVLRTWQTGLGTVDNFTKSRTMLNLLDRDIQMIVLRRDLGAFVNTTTNVPACAFCANIQGYPGTDTRAISLVAYTNVIVPNVSATLQRLNYGMSFVPTGISPTVGTNTLAQIANIPANGVENLATGVVAFKWQFIDGNGYYQTPNPPSTPAFLYDFAAPGSPTNYRTVVVSMVVMSDNAYNLAIKTGTLSRLTDGATDFPTTLPLSATNQSFATYWSGLLNHPAGNTFDPALPAPVRDPGGISVIERHIPLPTIAASY